MGTDRLVLERLTPLDVSNLRIERHGLPMNVAALAILEGRVLLDASGELALEAIRVRIGQRLHLAPRLRQRLYRPGFGFGAPVWVDDASFDISRHVRTRPAPAGGGEEALLAACVELNDRPFDQAHPLWEIWLLTGALDGHVSMLIRFHHVLADGIAALLLLGTLFDSAPFDSVAEAPEAYSKASDRVACCPPGYCRLQALRRVSGNSCNKQDFTCRSSNERTAPAMNTAMAKERDSRRSRCGTRFSQDCAMSNCRNCRCGYLGGPAT